jgi:hypothetical protein
MINGKVATSKGNVFTIAHQYDRIAGWKERIEETYEDWI